MKLNRRLFINLAGEEGFEPSLPGPEPGVLPLDYSPATPQNRTGIGQKIQSLLSNPHQYLASLSYRSIAELILKDQSGHAWSAGILLDSTTIRRVYNDITDDADDTLPLVGPLTLLQTIVTTVPNNANETKKLSLAAKSTLPESVVEVML